uniref:Putative capsid protein n=1 Tax=viral metagenome TaxID=1070528 RepID=A0A6M3JR81_9ZZZZ
MVSTIELALEWQGVPKFKTMKDMEDYWYGDINSDMIQKANAHLISSTVAYWNKMYGAKVWTKINYEANPVAVIPKEPWVKTGWRLETATGRTAPTGGIAEGAASAFTAIPETVTPTTALISASPKIVAHTFGNTELAALLQGQDDVIPLSHFREQLGKEHQRNIAAYLVQDVDTAADNGFESLDRVASSNAESSHLSGTTDNTIYGLARSAGTTYDAQVSSTGTATSNLRDLSISLIDGVWNSVTEAGGMPKVIITKGNTKKVWSGLLEAERRYDVMSKAFFTPRYGGAAGTTPGVEAGFWVATYHGVPIIETQHYPSSLAAARANEVGPILMLDIDYIRFATLMPTQFVQSNLQEDKFGLDAFGMKMMYETVGELRAYSFAQHGKLRDIK